MESISEIIIQKSVTCISPYRAMPIAAAINNVANKRFILLCIVSPVERVEDIDTFLRRVAGFSFCYQWASVRCSFAYLKPKQLQLFGALVWRNSNLVQEQCCTLRLTDDG